MLDPTDSRSGIAVLVVVMIAVVESNLSGKSQIHIFHGVVMK